MGVSMLHGYKFHVIAAHTDEKHIRYYVFNDDERAARLAVQKQIPVKKTTEIKKIKKIPARLFHLQNIPYGWCGPAEGDDD